MIYINGRFLTRKITGVERYATEITKVLVEITADLVVLVPPGRINKELDGKLKIVEIGLLRGIPWEQSSLPVFLRKKGSPLLLNLCNTAPLFYSNKTVTIHDLAFMANPAWFSKAFSLYYKFLIPKVAKSAKKIFTDSEFSKNEIMRYFDIDQGKIEVVHCAVPKTFGQAGREKKQSKYGKYFLAVSSIDPRKNFPRVVKAFKKADLKDTKLVIVGAEIKSFPSFDLESIKSDNILFTGYVSDNELRNLYANALGFVYATLYEGFGMPPLEAMAMGCPVIASNVASLPEVCKDAAIYVNPTDIGSIAEGFKRLASNDNLRERLITKGKDNIKRFSWEKSAHKFYEIVRNLEP